MKALQTALDQVQIEADAMKASIEEAAQMLRDGDEEEALEKLEELLGEDDADEMDDGDEDEDDGE